ncbi:MAG: hypothetical protein LBE48_03685 [Methanomassiliicoccaceae archaeon]|nr:hypothetical protein [Methanomassiliicoccaceae archaeon]
MSENRVDPTVAGLFLVSFITLVFGFLGLGAYTENMWIDTPQATGIAVFVGILIAVLMVSAIRCGNAFAAALYGFVAITLFLPSVATGTAGFIGMGGEFGAMFMFIIAAILYIVFMLVALFVGAPKLLVIILFLVALLYLFVGLFVNALNNNADPKTFGLLFGIFGVLAGLVSMYLAFALSTQKAPVF